MSQGFSKRSIVTSILDHSTTQKLAAVLAFTSISAPLSWYRDGTINPILILVVFLLLLVSLIFAKRQSTQSILPSRKDSEQFFPFLSHANVGKKDDRQMLLSREAEANALAKHIFTNASKHCFLVGESGVGKSVLLGSYFDFSKYGQVCVPIVEYRNLFEQVHQRLISEVQIESTENANLAYKKMMDSIDRSMDQEPKHYEDCVKHIENYVEAIKPENHVIVIFEQAERALRMLRSSNSEERRYSSFARELISELRSKPNIHTLFVLRGDYAVEAMESLIDYEASPVYGHTFDFVSIFVLSGVDVGSGSENYGILREKVVEGVGFSDYQKFNRALMIERPTRSNTFLIQLTGYMLEHFAQLDPRVLEILEEPSSLRTRLIDLYFEKLANEFYVRSAAGAIPPSDARSVLFAVLFVLAEENRGTGKALSKADLAHLSHLPLGPVNAAVEFLIEKGVAQKTGGNGEVRIAHDILAESVAKSDEIHLRPEYKSTYRSFSESAFVTAKATEGVAQRNILIDLLNRGKPTAPQIFILVCMLLCIFRALWPSEALSLWLPINQALERILPGAVSTDNVSLEFYLPIMVTHFFWVSFMYKLDRAYFASVLRTRGGLTRFFSSTGAPLGALCGAILVFSPSLFIVPILAGGTFLAIAYWLHSLSVDVNGPSRAISKELSFKIGFNMVVSIGATAVVYTLLNITIISDEYWWQLSTIWFFCFCYVWYWFAMQPRQGTQEGWSTMLLMYDRGRQLQ